MTYPDMGGMSETGVVFNIQRFSIHDGPGIRTTVFLKGCSMACFWCHNPEGRRPRPEIMYYADRCIACGDCVAACPNQAHSLVDGLHTFDRDQCQTAGECVQVCCSEALEMVGTVMTVDEVVEEVLRDKPFYATSGGGVTLSGGEPTLKSEFCIAVMSRLQDEGVHTAIETCGNSHWHDIEAILPATDLVMMDLKSLETERHRKVTGVWNERILQNARLLAQTDVPLLFRTPVVPGVNDDEGSFSSIVSFVQSLIELRAISTNGDATPAPIEYELLTFHKLAGDKYHSLGMDYKAADLDVPTAEHMQKLALVARGQGLTVTVK